MRRTTYIWLGFRITLTPLTRRIYKEGSGRLLRRNVSYIAQYFTPFGGGSEQGDPLTGPPSHWSPISLVPFSLVPQLIGPPIHYWSSLVPHLIGPPYHWSPISLVPLFISHPIIGQSQWSPISLVPHLIGPPSHWSPDVTLAIQFSLVPHLIGPPMQPWLYSSHWPPI